MATSRQVFYGNGTFTAQAGVTSVDITSFRTAAPVVNLSAASGAFAGLVDVFGNAYMWGNNNNGQLGIGDTTPRSSPIAVLGGLAFSTLVGGETTNNTMFGLVNGKAYAWGQNPAGTTPLGIGAGGIPQSSPVAVLGGLSFSTLISGGSAYTFGLTPAGKLYAWGANTNGQLGVGDVLPRSSPVAVLGGLSFSKIIPDPNNSFVLGLTTDGVLYAWGRNVSGNLGLGDVTPRSSPVAVLGGLTFASVSTRASSVKALTPNGTMYAWGSNTNGQLGVGDVLPRSSPVAVLGGLKFAQAISGSSTVLAITLGGVAYAWGYNGDGEVGNGNVTPQSSPVAVLGSLNFSKIYSDEIGAFYGITPTGACYAWGYNNNGQLATGDSSTPRSSPTAVIGGISFSNLYPSVDSQGAVSMYGMGTNSKLYAWGANANGQLGVGDVVPRSSPVAVLGSLLPNGTPQTQRLSLSVTPGTSYAINMLQYTATFGRSIISNFVPDTVVVEFDQ